MTQLNNDNELNAACRAVVGDQKTYGYQFPTAVKAQRARIKAATRAKRVYEAAERKAYVNVTDYNHFSRLVSKISNLQSQDRALHYSASRGKKTCAGRHVRRANFLCKST